ncbi:MAG: ABC transporter permease [Ferruginibacter sp.]|nr:ABC transporter permease [Cytophagales bacterium]
MVGYLWKRIRLLLPTLWLITSAVFVLSRLAAGVVTPDQPGDDARLGSTSVGNELKTGKQYLQKTGQDLPLFYLSLQTLAEPDTLHRLASVRDRRWLGRLISRYGNWPEIARYYRPVSLLRAQLQRLLDPARKADLNRQLDRLASRAEAAEVAKTLARIRGLAAQFPASPDLARHAQLADARWVDVVGNAQPWRNLVPVVRWHGTENQYHRWLGGIVRGNLGQSYRHSRPVTDLLGESLANTFGLVLSSILLTLLLAVWLGVWLVHPGHRRWRGPVLALLYVFDTVPLFLLALVLLLALTGSGLTVFLPVFEQRDFSAGFAQYASSRVLPLVLPVGCLVLATLPYLTGQFYQALRQVESQEYIQTARAKGLSEGQVLGRHALRNALLPLITLFTGLLPALVGGALVIEVIFAVPGMGQLLMDAVLARNYPVVMGIVLCLALAKIGALLLADWLYYLADPRVRFGG